MGKENEGQAQEGQAQEGQAQGQPVQESSLAGEFVPLREKAVRRDGTVGLKLIAPGWGASGYYPAETLRRDGPKTFKAGTKMYWNHPTMAQESERPEGDLRDLAAVLVSDARWEESGAAGPGLYADAKVFGDYAPAVEELAPHIGVSIRASGRAATGEAEGRQGPIINALTVGRSVDFVTEPGAGGRIVEMFEAARPGAGADGGRRTADGDTKLAEARNVGEWFEARLHYDFTARADEMFGEGYLTREERIALSSAIGDALDAFRSAIEGRAAQLYQRDIFAQAPTDNRALSAEESGRSGAGTRPAPTTGGQKPMDELEKVRGELVEAQGRIAALETERDRLAETLVMRDAEGIVREALAQVTLPGVTVARLQQACSHNPPVDGQGKLDVAGLKQRVQESVAAETQYLQEAAGWGQGRIEGMGGGQGAAGSVDMAVVERRLANAFADLGFATEREG